MNPSPPPPPPPARPVITEETFRTRVAELRQRLAQCKEPSLVRVDAEKEREALQEAQRYEWTKEVDQIYNDADLLDKIRQELLTRQEVKVEVPFEGLEAEVQGLRAKILNEDKEKGPEVKACLEEEARTRVGKVEELAAMRAAELLAMVEAEAPRVVKGEAPLTRLEELQGRLATSKANLLRAFPGTSRDWAQVFPEERVGRIAQVMAEQKDLVRRAEEGLKALTLLESDLKAPRPSSAWKESEFTQRIEKSSAELASLKEKAPGLPTLKAAETKRQEVQVLRERWSRHAQVVAQAKKALSGKQIAEHDRLVKEMASEGIADPDLEVLASARRAVAAAFEHLQKLKVPEARKSFQELLTHLRALKEPTAWPEGCLIRLDELEKRVQEGMVPISAGRVQVRKGPVTPVEAFFLDRGETSIKEYRRFVVEITGKSFEEVKDRGIWASEAAFKASQKLPSYLENPKDLDEEWPIELVSYQQALACLRWQGKDLPRLEEWWLAGKGDLDLGFQESLPVSVHAIHSSSPTPTGTTSGGEARLFKPPNTIHHLSGNVAEWTRVGTDARAEVVGGSYRTRGDQKVFSGAVSEAMSISEVRKGVGFRGIVRPGDFFAGLLPEGMEGR